MIKTCYIKNISSNRINNLIVLIIIFCSTAAYHFAPLGPLQKAIELLGTALIVAFLILHLVYSKPTIVKMNFSTAIVLILVSVITSMFMAYYSRNQNFVQSIYAQRALYYYLFYYLLHYLKVNTRFLEKVFIFFGVVHIILYLIQFFAYPKILFDVFMLSDRGTIRIYLTGSDYMVIAFFMAIHAYLRTNKLKYLFGILAIFSIFILMGGRMMMVIMAFVVILFLLFSKRVKSRILIGFLLAIGSVLVFVIFQDIFMHIIKRTEANRLEGADYVRIRATIFFLTDFFKNPLAYITGNGIPHPDSAYGYEIGSYQLKGLFLGDVGLIGNFALLGSFFIIGVFWIIVKAVSLKLESKLIYLRYMFIAIALTLITAGGFVNSDFICFAMCALYIMDVSNHKINYL